MLTRDELADVLKRVNVARVAEEAQVSTKTVYRLRHKANSPTLDTVERLVSAVRKLNAMRQGTT